MQDLRIFTGNANPKLAEDVAKELGIELGKGEVGRFSDGEIRIKIEESVRGLDVFIIQPTCYPVNDNLMELLLLIDAFKRASARRITAVIPYYGYGRQEKKVRPREPISAKLVADLISVAGADRVLTIDLHADQIQGFFNCPVDQLTAVPILAEYFRSLGLSDNEVVVVSPDVGGVARARHFAELLGAPLAIIAKRRPEPNRAEAMEIIGDVKGKIAIMVDDIVDTAGSLMKGIEAMFERGVRKVYGCCTHPVLSGEAVKRIEEGNLEELVVTDTIPLRDKRSEKIKVLSIAPLLAEAILRIHNEKSVSVLFQRVPQKKIEYRS
ncbi:ribose-phosphate pyrophosphokinase [bacterium]|nr:ribose-phosphate pyrophosphokinase [bacterium]